MRALRSHSLSVLAMLLLLLGTASPALARMTCVAAGHTVVSVGQVADCCPDKEATQATVSATCCELGVAAPHRADFTPASGITMPAVQAVAPAWPVIVPQPLMLPATALTARRDHPPLPGSQVLADTGVFRL